MTDRPTLPSAAPPSPSARPMNAAEWGLLLLLSLVWGGSFLFNAVAVEDLPPLTIVLLRVVLAAGALHLVLRLSGERLPRGAAEWRAFVVMGLFNNALPFTLIVSAQATLASGVAAILNATTPLFTVLVAHVATRDEKLTAGRLAGVAVGFAGVAVMIGTEGLSFDAGGLAELFCLLAALSYGVSGVYGRRFRRLGVSPLGTATGMLTASSAMLLPVALLVDRPWALAPPGLAAIASVVAIALVSTAFAYILFFRVLASAGATNISLVTLLVPVSAVALGILFLDETLLARHLVGFAGVAAGLALIDGRPLALLRRWGGRAPA